MLAIGHAGQGRQRLALRTGAHDDNLIVGQVINIEGIDDIGVIDVEVTSSRATRVFVSMERPVTTTYDPLAGGITESAADDGCGSRTTRRTRDPGHS